MSKGLIDTLRLKSSAPSPANHTTVPMASGTVTTRKTSSSSRNCARSALRRSMVAGAVIVGTVGAIPIPSADPPAGMSRYPQTNACSPTRVPPPGRLNLRVRTAGDPRRAGAQPAQHQPRPAPRQAHRAHRAVGFGEVVARLRHHLRGGSAALRRVACPPTPASSWARWTSPTSTSSRVSHLPSRSTRNRRHATPGRRSGPSPRSTTTSGCCTPASACPTVPSAARRSLDRRRNRSSIGCSSCRKAPASRCWRRSCGAARAPTRRCSPTWRRKASPGPASTARCTSSPTRSTSPATRCTRSRSSSTAS